MSTFAGRDWLFPLQTEPAVNAPLSAIEELATDGSGNIYIADEANNVVVRVDKSGNSSIFAGNGIPGYTGDGGPATSSSLSSPAAVAVDSAGNVYISDSNNNRIRKVNTAGIITTFAGTGVFGHDGDQGPAANALISSPRQLSFAPNGSLYFVENTYYIRMIDTAGNIHTIAGNSVIAASPDGVAAIGASLNNVEGIAIDAQGNVYFSEFNGNRVRKVNTQGLLASVAGTGAQGATGDFGPALSATLWGPWGLALDPKGDLIISDTNNKRVRMVSPAGIISTIAGTGSYGFSGDGGPATTAVLSFPEGLALDSSGNIWFADTANLRVRRFTLGGNIATVAGDGLYRNTPNGSPVSQLYLLSPYTMTFDNSGNLIVADTYLHALHLIQTNGQVTLLAGISTNGGHSPDQTAATALLDFPIGVAVAKDGTIYIAEQGTSLIRKITPAGALVTVAGTFNSFAGGYSGDGGPATSATLNQPFAVALDSKGNLYISDLYNHRIRKVDLNGIITTYAGNGTQGFSGDGGPATSAELNYPDYIVFDASDNLYIADQFNGRIRKVTTSGIISTIAGTGKSGGPAGDGQLAILANIPNPVGLAFDAGGNLYVSEPNWEVVRRIGTDGNISTVAGNGLYGYSGDGGLATAASLNFPNGLAIDGSGNLYIADTLNNRIREALTVGPALTVSPASLSLTASAGASNNPTSAVSISAALNGVPQTGLGYSATSSVPWLTVSPANGTIPQNLTVTVNASSLTAGPYTGTITIAAPGATPSSFTVNVSLTVAAANPPQLVIGSQLITVSATQGGTPTTSTISLSNTGGGTIAFNATAQTPPGQSWLTVTPSTGQISNGTPASVAITATPGNLAVGTYSGAVIITGVAGTTPIASQIPVTLSITQSSAIILLSQTGLTFTAIAGGGTPLSQNFGVLNTGQGSMNWTATAVSPTGGAVPWLTLVETSGTVARPYLDVSLVDVAVNPNGLAAGDYYAQILVSSPAGNSPQSMTVLLTVKPAGTVPSIEIQPSGLIFTGQASSPPGSQLVRLATQASTANNFRANPATFDGAPWLVSVPGTGSVTPAQGASVTVQPNFSSLNPGVYFGTITFLFGDNTSRTVNVLTVVAPPGVSGNHLSPASSCAHTQAQFQLTSTQPGSDGSFNAPVGQPLKLQFKIAFTCDGTPLTTGAVSVDFTGGQEPHLTLAHVGNGVWETTWTPVANPAQFPQEPVTVTALWVDGSNPEGQKYTGVKANLVSGTSVPVIKAGGVVSAASPNTSQAVGVGGLVTIYGSQLATGVAAASAVPLPQNLAGTTVTLQGQNLPLLYASNGQINVQIPYEVTPNVTQTLVVNRGGALSAAVPLAVASVQPSIFLAGPTQAVVVDGNGVLKDPTSPATAGSVVTIYCTGLGPVTPAVASGTGATGPTSLVNPASLTIGGQPATIQYAGLTPGSPGLYQVNAVIPAGATGNSVPIILTVGTQSSPAATIAIR